MLIVINLVVVALVVIGAFAVSSSGARPKDTRSVDDAAAAAQKIAQTPNTQQS